MRTLSSDRASSRRRHAWILAGAAALSAAPAACSHDSGGSAGDKEPGIAPLAPTGAVAAKIAALRARFPAALAPATDVRLLDDPAAETIRTALATPSSRLATIELPRRADGAVHLTDDASGLHITFALEGAAPAPVAIDGGLALYAGAAPGSGDVIHLPHASGTEDFVHFDRAPAKEELRYRVDVSRAAGLRLVANTLELLDAAGTPLLRVAPPFVLDAQGRRSEASLAVEGCAADTDARAPFRRPVTSPGAAFCTVSVDWRGAHVTYPVLVDPAWQLTSNTLITKRLRHTMTLLNPSDAKSLALIAGGFSTVGNGPSLKTAELYDPLSRRFTATGSMNVARGSHTATLLTKVGKPSQPGSAEPVLVAGGADSAGTPLASVEIYDPATGLFQTDPTPMTFPRFGHSATLFADKTVLLAGGTTLPLNQPTSTASVYTFTSLVNGVLTSTLTPTSGTMAFSRTGLAAAPLASGRVLLTGGFVLAGGSLQALQSAELYDPTTNAFIPIPTAGGGILQMSVQRGFHTATPIGNGLVLVAGGLTNTAGGTNPTAVDLYADGSVGTVTGFVNQASPLSLATGRASHTATLLATGDVLIAGGFNAGSAINAEEVFLAKTSKFKPLDVIVPMTARGDHAALLVNAGDWVYAGHTVLVTGGTTSSMNGSMALDSAQILFNSNGDACTIGDECLSGFCADGVCCDTACDEECYACSAATTQSGLDGTCSPAKQGSDPRVQCINELEIHTQCDGKGSTEQVGTTKDCKPGVCGADNLCSTFCTTSNDCSATGFCDLTAPSDAGAGPGTCSPKRINSTICTADEQCVSNNCIDGLCCDLRCEGQCQACDNPGFPGKCTTFGSESAPEQPHPNKGGKLPRTACDGVSGSTVTSCAGRCTGAADPLLCQYPGVDKTLQATTCTDISGAPSKLTAYPCDGKGTNTEVNSDCGGFLCADATTCKTSCSVDTECLTDWVCTDKVCQKLTGPLCDGTNILRKPGGNVTCADHYTCPAGATACRTDCDSVIDCTDGLVCNNDRQCVERLDGAVITACSASSPGSTTGDSLPWLFALAALAVSRRRVR